MFRDWPSLPDPWWGAFKERHRWFDEDGNPKAMGTAKKTTIKQRLAIIGAQGALPPGNRPQARLRFRIIDDGPMAERFGTRLGDDEIEALGIYLRRCCCISRRIGLKSAARLLLILGLITNKWSGNTTGIEIPCIFIDGSTFL